MQAMQMSSHKRIAPIDVGSQLMNKKQKTKFTDSPIAGTRITDWDEYEKWKEVRGDIEPTMNYVEITPEAIEELRKIKNIIGDYVCQLCKVKYENAFALAMHKCPRVVHIEFRCPECDKTFNCPANLASHRRWHKPQPAVTSIEPVRVTVSSKVARCSSRSDSRSTTSTVSDTIPESSSSSSTTLDLSKKNVVPPMYNESSHRVFHPMASPYMKHASLFAHHRPLPISPSFDFRRLQSSCIFCHEQFTELHHLLQHIRKNHAVSSSSPANSLEKIVF